MNAERLLELYEKVTEAPDAIERLRRFVLDLAVRGKLVEQDPAQEPASGLLKQIAAQKARMVKVGEIRKPRGLANGEELEAPFEIPATWRWCRLDTVGAIIGGGTPSAGDPNNFTEPGDGIPWLTPADLGGYRKLYIKGGARDLTDQGLKASSATMMPAGTVLFTSRAPIGYVAIAANPISTNQGFKSIVPYVADCSRFLALAMQTFAPEIDAKAPGTTFKEVSGKIVAAVPFPLPPLAEQRRIVTKVEELMALLDRLEAARTARETTRDRLTTASLARLTASDAFPDHARFALEALPTLTARPGQIKSLRQTILDLAVRGKLEQQNPADESAQNLLNRGKGHLSRSRGAQMKKQVDAERTDLIFRIPSHWEPAFVAQVLTKLQTGPFGSSLHKSDYQTGGTPVINPASIQNGRIVPVSGMAVGEETLERLSTFKVCAGDIILARRGEMGRCAVVSEREEGWLCGTGSLVLKTIEGVFPYYLALLISSPTGRAFLGGAAVGTTMQNLNQSILLNMPFGLPPYDEQRRIVTRVSELVTLLDRLEPVLTEADAILDRLLAALLSESVRALSSQREAT